MLVIEDAADVLDVLTVLLRIEGAAVTGARNGLDGLALFHRGYFDVVVTDLGLPDLSGDMVIRTIVAAARPPTAVVVITGETQPARARALHAGASVVFGKPCEWGSIIAHLEGLTASRAA